MVVCVLAHTHVCVLAGVCVRACVRARVHVRQCWFAYSISLLSCLTLTDARFRRTIDVSPPNTPAQSRAVNF